jgi:hypothetical protein
MSLLSNKFAIVDSVTLRILVTSYNEVIIRSIFNSGFKTNNGTFKVIKI